jgi:hypothetical protein
MLRTNVWLATTILREGVRTSAGEDIGKIEELVIDPESGRILYAVLFMPGYPELFVVPWSLFNGSAPRNQIALNVDRKTLERAPSFDPGQWPEMTDPSWQSRINDYYAAAHPATIRERAVYVERKAPVPTKEMSVLSAVALVFFLIGLLWFTFLVSTRGWERVKTEIMSSVQGAAYAMKETSLDATLTTKVKAALSLSKRIPADEINVDSNNGVVTLRGEVASEEIRGLAETITRDTPGVRAVRNHLYVISPAQ